MIAQSKASGLGCTLEQTPATLLPPSTTSGCPARTPRGPSRLPTDGGRRHGAERERGGGDSPWSSSASGPCLSFFLCSSSPSLENPRFLFSNSPVLLSRKPPTISAHSVGETFLCISYNNKIGNFPSLTEKNQEAWSVLVARGHVAAPWPRAAAPGLDHLVGATRSSSPTRPSLLPAPADPRPPAHPASGNARLVWTGPRGPPQSVRPPGCHHLACGPGSPEAAPLCPSPARHRHCTWAATAVPYCASQWPEPRGGVQFPFSWDPDQVTALSRPSVHACRVYANPPPAPPPPFSRISRCLGNWREGYQNSLKTFLQVHNYIKRKNIPTNSPPKC